MLDVFEKLGHPSGMRTLTTTDEVIDALGGTMELARALGLSKSVVSRWRNHTIASKYRDLMSEMLFDVGACAPPTLWGMAEQKPSSRWWHHAD